MAQTVFKRYEKKYLLNADQFRLFLEGIAPRMHPDEFGLHEVCNIYYDTDDYDLIRYSIEAPVYKEKLRLRTYGVPTGGDYESFVELKKKYKGVVYKRRVLMPVQVAEDYLTRHIHPGMDTQIIREIDWFMKVNPVKPSVYLAYSRQAFIDNENPEFRLTFDRNIRSRRDNLSLLADDVGEAILPSDIVLMEIKIPGVMPLWMSRLLAELNIEAVRFSKYGTYYMQHEDMVKKVISNHNGGAEYEPSVTDIADVQLGRMMSCYIWN